MKKKSFALLALLAMAVSSCSALPAVSTSSSTSVSTSTSTVPSSEASSEDSSSTSSEPSVAPSVSDEVSPSTEETSPSAEESISVETTYNISKAEGLVGGDISFDKLTAKAGETITVTIAPSDGYRFEALTSGTIVFTKVSETTYTFAMPEEDVVVSATFVQVTKIKSINNLNLKETEFNMTTLSIKKDDVYDVGETVTATINATDTEYGIYYTRAESVYFRVNDVTVMGTYDEDSKSSSGYLQQVKFTFVMPDSDADIYLLFNNSNYTNATSGHKITVDADPGVMALGFNPDRSDYTSITLYVYRLGDYMVSLKMKETSAADDAWTPVEFSKTNGNAFDNNLASCYISNFSNDITIKITAVAVSSRTITYVGLDKVELNTSTYTEFPNTFLPGENYSLAFKEKEANKYLLPCTVTGVTPTKNEDGSLIFAMPDNDITIEFVTGDALAVSFKENNEGTVLNLSALGVQRKLGMSTYTSAIPSAKNYLMASSIKTDTGYGVVGIKVNDGEMIYPTTSSYMGNYFAFDAPASGNIEITICTSETYNISVATITGITVNTYSGTVFAAGSQVTCSYYISDPLSSLDQIGALDSKNSPIEINATIDAANSTFTFTMPESDITIVPVLKKQAGLNLTFDYNGFEEYFIASGDNRSTITNCGSWNTSYFPAESSESKPSFLAGQSYTLSVKLIGAASKFNVSIEVTDSTQTTTITPNYFSYNEYSKAYVCDFNNNYNNYVINGDTTFKFLLTERTDKITGFSVDKPEGATLTYYVNDTKVDNLDHVYTDDYLVIKANDPGVNKEYSIVLTDSDGNEVSKNYSGSYQISEGYKITVTEIEAYRISLTCPTTAYGNKCSIYDTSYNSYGNDDYLLPGSALQVNSYVSGHILVTCVGSETALVDEDIEAYNNVTFTPTGDVTIVLTEAA